MNLTIEKSKESDIDNIMPLFDAARTTMAKLGIDQWQGRISVQRRYTR